MYLPWAAPGQPWGRPRADAHFQIFMCPGAAPGQIEEKWWKIMQTICKHDFEQVLRFAFPHQVFRKSAALKTDWFAFPAKGIYQFTFKFGRFVNAWMLFLRRASFKSGQNDKSKGFPGGGPAIPGSLSPLSCFFFMIREAFPRRGGASPAFPLTFWQLIFVFYKANWCKL